MGPEPSAEQKSAALDLPALVLECKPFRLEWMESPWEDVTSAGEWLLELEAQHGPQIVHVNGYAHAARDFRAPVLIVAHSCVATWFRAVKNEPLPARFGEYRRAVMAGLAAADGVVSPTRAMLDALEREYRHLPRASVIPNGMTLESSAGDELQKSPVILAAGRLWDEAKNVAALEAIADRLSWPVRIAGQTTSPNGRRFSAGAATLLGFLDAAAMKQELRRAAIFAHPARYEPFGLSVLEAAHAGCALVLGDIPTLREVWGDAALYVTPDDHEALRTALSLVIANEPLRRALGTRASARAAEHSAERMGRSYLTAYRALGQGAAGSCGDGSSVIDVSAASLPAPRLQAEAHPCG